VELHRYPTPSHFLAHAEPGLLEREAENNLILGFARMAAIKDSAPRPYFAAVADGDQICIAGFSTVPEKVGITQATRPDALSLLADDIHTACSAARLALGPEPGIGAFARLLAQRRGTVARQQMRQRIHELVQVESGLRLPAGRLRPAESGDLYVVAEWIGRFMGETGEMEAGAVDIARDRVENGRLFLWDDGSPVSMAAWAGKTANGVRVNFVYTPAELRGRGYATATVAALSQRLLDQGNRFCCLYTDLANPTSNAIYHRIGYRPVCDAAVYGIGG
jgi:hypothetical protein